MESTWPTRWHVLLLVCPAHSNIGSKGPSSSNKEMVEKRRRSSTHLCIDLLHILNAYFVLSIKKLLREVSPRAALEKCGVKRCKNEFYCDELVLVC